MNARQRRKLIREARWFAGDDFTPEASRDPDEHGTAFGEALGWRRCWAEGERYLRQWRATAYRRRLCPRCVGHAIEAQAPDYSCIECLGQGEIAADARSLPRRERRRVFNAIAAELGILRRAAP